MILVIDIGNTTIALTGLRQRQREEISAPETEPAATEPQFSAPAQVPDLEVCFSEKVPGEAGRAEPRSSASAQVPDLEVCFSEKVPTETGREEAGFAEAAQEILRKNMPQGARIRLVSISSVVPACTPAALAFGKEICDTPPVNISFRSRTGLSFADLPAPERVGADRIADSAWAAARFPLPVMTADLGTATTINVVAPSEDSASAVFLGGMIGTGVRTSLLALRSGTAQLPALEPRQVSPENLIGRDTDGCMLSAAVVGTAAMIEGIADRVERQLGAPLTLVLTGGNARLAAPWIRRPFCLEPDLAAKGAALVALREGKAADD